MQTTALAIESVRPEWVRRFAYRAMLCRHELDTQSAMLIADSQFDGACDLEPETAAEIYADGPDAGTGIA